MIGLDDIVVISTRDAVLLTPKAQADKIKEMMALIDANSEVEAGAHREIQCPRGEISVGRRGCPLPSQAHQV